MKVGTLEHGSISERFIAGEFQLINETYLSPAADSYTKLLAHFSDIGANFKDASGTNKVITANGGARIIGNKFSQGAVFDGSGDYISVPDHADWDFGTGNFTIEMWVMLFDVDAYHGFFTSSAGLSDWNDAFFHHIDNRIEWSVEGTNNRWNWDPSAFQWYHLAFVRNGTALAIYVDGTALTISVGGTNSSDVSCSGSVRIGAGNVSSANVLTGLMDEVRISNVARYTSNFAAPTQAFTSDSNTKLLLHCDGTHYSTTFTDSGNTGHSPSANGDVKIYDASKFGNIGYLDGSGDYLSIADSPDWDFGTGAFTLEGWFRWKATGGNYMLITRSTGTSGDNQCTIYHSANNFYCYIVGTAALSDVAFTPTLGTWYHIALVRSGTSVYLFVNGSQLGSTGSSSGDISSSSQFYIGSRGAELYFNGTVDEVRISNTARWTSNFSVETSAYAGTEPVTSLTISGLNGDEDDEYLLISKFISGSGSATGFNLTCNSITSGYGWQRIYGESTTIGASRSTSAAFFAQIGVTGAAGNRVSFSETFIKAKSGINRTALVKFIKDINGTSVGGVQRSSNIWNESSANITSLTITADQTNGIGVGSHILLFKKSKLGIDGTSGLRRGNTNIQGLLKAGVFNKVYSTELSSAATSVTISNLDGNTEILYYLIVKTVSGYAGTLNLMVRPNNDSGSNYGQQYIRGSNTTSEAGSDSSANWNIGYTYTSTGRLIFSHFLLYSKSGYPRCLLGDYVGDINSLTIGALDVSGKSWNNIADNVTSLVVAASETNGLAAGTIIELWALKKGV